MDGMGRGGGQQDSACEMNAKHRSINWALSPPNEISPCRERELPRMIPRAACIISRSWHAALAAADEPF